MTHCSTLRAVRESVYAGMNPVFHTSLEQMVSMYKCQEDLTRLTFGDPVSGGQAWTNQVVRDRQVQRLHRIDDFTELAEVVVWPIALRSVTVSATTLVDCMCALLNQGIPLIQVRFVTNLQTDQVVTEDAFSPFGDFQTKVRCVVEWHTQIPLHVH